MVFEVKDLVVFLLEIPLIAIFLISYCAVLMVYTLILIGILIKDKIDRWRDKDHE